MQKKADVSEAVKNLTVDRAEFDAVLAKLVAAPQTAKNGIKPIPKKDRAASKARQPQVPPVRSDPRT